MRRRELIAGLLGVTAAWPRGAVAQPPKRRPLVAFLSALSSERVGTFRAAFLPRLQELGHVVGRDVEVVYRHADGDAARLPLLADELVRLKPDVVVTPSGVEAFVMRQAAPQTPIVSAILGNPNSPSLGLAGANARPVGNVTGILNNVDSLAGKMLELAIEVVGGATRVGALYVRGFQQNLNDLKQTRDAAAVKGIEVVPVEVNGAGDLEGAFERLARERLQVVFVFGHGMFVNERQRIATLAIAARLPTMYAFREHVVAGGLMSYGSDLNASFARTADFVDKLLKGAKIADLPVELPTKFLLVINLKTAKAIGLTISEQVLVRTDEIIE